MIYTLLLPYLQFLSIYALSNVSQVVYFVSSKQDVLHEMNSTNTRQNIS
jgi:hypothetical protein